MKIQHDGEVYSIICDDGTESSISDFGVNAVAESDSKDLYIAVLDSPTESGDYMLEPVIYKLVKQPTTIEEVEFDDADPEDEDQEDEGGAVERSAPEKL